MRFQLRTNLQACALLCSSEKNEGRKEREKDGGRVKKKKGGPRKQGKKKEEQEREGIQESRKREAKKKELTVRSTRKEVPQVTHEMLFTPGTAAIIILKSTWCITWNEKKPSPSPSYLKIGKGKYMN